MASYRGHLMFASALGVGYGAVGLLRWQLDSGTVILGAVLTTVGGLLPDLDSDSGVPVRELFSAAATVIPLILFPRLDGQGFSPEQNLVIMVGIYVAIRYVLSSLFKRFTVHRGMFHSIPALLIAGLATYLLYQSPVAAIRFFLAGGVAIGFLSHLGLDEIYAVDFMGRGIKSNQFAGSALKFTSKSFLATGICYLILGGLVYLAMEEKGATPQPMRPGARIAFGP